MTASGLSLLLLLDAVLGDERQPFQPSSLHVIAMRTRERISAPYELNIDAVSTEQAIDSDRLLYTPISLTVRRRDGTNRHFHGLVHRVDVLDVEQRGRWEYRLSVVARPCFLSQSVDGLNWDCCGRNGKV